MAKRVLTDVRLFVGAADLSGQSNMLELTSEMEEKEVTNWRSGGAREVLGGLESVSISSEGQWEAGDPGLIDDQQWATRRVLHAWTMGASDASDTGTGALAWLTKALRTSITLFGSVGDVAPWNASATGSWPLVRGQFAHPSGTARTSDGDGAALELGAVGDRERAHASLHVLSASGTDPELDVTVESAADQAFSSPTTRLTFDTATEPDGQILRTNGDAITDTWWRVSWDVAGTDPSFLFVAALGIE